MAKLATEGSGTGRTEARSEPKGSVGVLSGWHYRWIGIDPALMARCGRMEQILYTTLAMSVALTVSLAVMYGTISSAIYTTGRTQIGRGHIFVGLFIGFGIYVLERVLLATFTRDVDDDPQNGDPPTSSKVGTYGRLALLSATRISIAIVIASLVAEPILLVVYEDDIEVVLQARRDAEVHERIEAIDAEFAVEIAGEVPDSPEVLAAQERVATLEGERDAQQRAATEASAKEEASKQLAVCESGGSVTQLCRDLLGAGDDLSGEQSCGPRCLAHEDDARRYRDEAKLANDSIARIDAVDLPAAQAALDQAREQNRASLAVDLDRSDTIQSNYSAPSDARARQECAVTEIQILHNRIATSDPRLPYLFGYCATDPGDEDIKAAGEKVLADLENAPKVYSGLAPRQEAFEVLKECSDPLGLRSDEVVGGEPIYCAVASGKIDASDATEPPDSDTSTLSTVLRPLRGVLHFGDSTIAQGALRLAWVILILDLLPLFLKLSMSLRSERPYDGWATLDKRRDLLRQRTVWETDVAQEQANRDIALHEIDVMAQRRREISNHLVDPSPLVDPAGNREKSTEPEDPSSEKSDEADSSHGDAAITPPVEPRRREVFHNPSVSFRVDQEKAFVGGSAILHLATADDVRVVVKVPKGEADGIAPEHVTDYLAMAQNDLGITQTFAPEIGTQLFAKDHSTGRYALEYHPRGSLDRYLGIDGESTHIRADFSLAELLTVLEQVVSFNFVLWDGRYTHLDIHAGNYVLCGKERETGLLTETPARKSTQNGALRAIDFGTCTRIGESPKLGQGRLMPPEHQRSWVKRGDALDYANPLWDVYQTGRFAGTLLTSGGWGPIEARSSDPEPLQKLATIACRWMSADPLGRMPSVDLRTPLWPAVVAETMTEELTEIRRSLGRRGGHFQVMKAGDPNNGFASGERIDYL